MISQVDIGFEFAGHAAHRRSLSAKNMGQVHIPRHHGVAADIVGTQVHSHALGETQHTRFGHSVGRIVGPGAVGMDRRSTDNAASFALLYHDTGGLLTAKKKAFETHVQGQTPCIILKIAFGDEVCYH